MNIPKRLLAAVTCAVAIGMAPLFGHGFDVLVFSKTGGFRHSSIDEGVTALQELGVLHEFGVTHTEDAAVFVNELPNHQVVVFLNTTGDILDAGQESAFQSWYRNGGGFLGIHSAADTEHGWPWYLQMLGAEFASHPAIQVAEVKVLDQVHPITNAIDPATTQRVERWTRSDEWYNFVTSPRGEVHVLAVLDEATYSGGTHGDDHPIAWCHEFDGGRSAYFGMGHVEESYTNGIFRDLLTNAVEWAAGELDGDSGATIDGNYEKIVLDGNITQPMSLDVAPDGKIYFVERSGAVKVHDQETGFTTTIATLDEYSGGEYGVLGIALDPGFDPAVPATRHLFIYWSPSSGNRNRLSRFTLDAAGNLDPASEVVIMEFFSGGPTKSSAGHQSGCLRFDAAGNLFITTGDNANPGQYMARNDADVTGDARKSSSNPADLRGKILRITPDIGGGPPEHPNYVIPAGNLFAPGTTGTLPEIYVMGCRSCFRMCIDPYTGWLYFGDIGPDAAGDSVTTAYQGPRGYDEYNQVRAPGYYGWPYFQADNKAYLDGGVNPWSMTTLRDDLAAYFSQSSFLNGGEAGPYGGQVGGDVNAIPPARPAWIWYPYGTAPAQFSEMDGGGGRAAMAGAVYQFAEGKNFPPYHDKTVFLMEWSRNKILEAKTDANGDLLELTRFAPNLAFSRPHDMVIGPDGAMYILEWGSDFFGGTSADTALVMVRYTLANLTPVAIAVADVTSGSAPLTVNFSSAGSVDPEDGPNITYGWDFDGDQIPDSTVPNPQHTFTAPGTYVVQLTVTDTDGLFARANLVISAGNHAPVVTFSEPVNYGFFDWGDRLPFAFEVSDFEDGSSAQGQITGADVLLNVSLGHNDHQHTEEQRNALSGVVLVPRDPAHAFDADLAYVLDASYTDQGAPDVDPITGTAKIVLQPKVKMANNYDLESGVTTTDTSDPAGGFLDVISIDHGDWIGFLNFNLANIDAIRLRAAAAGDGGTVRVRQDSPTGTLVASIAVGPTGSTSNYLDFTGAVSGALGGNHDLYFVFEESPGATGLMNLNWISFRGAGATLTAERPRIDSVEVVSPTRFRLRFDQRVDRATAENPNHYSLDKGGAISSVVAAADQQSVLLNTGPLNAGEYYLVTINGVEDLAGDLILPDTTALLVTPSSGAQTGFALGINCGPTGPDALYIDPQGRVYYPDRLFDVGAGGGGSDPVANTGDDALYQTHRWATGDLTYEIPVPQAGSYDVTLKFAETYWTTDGSRLFDISVEGTAFESNLDVHARAGHDAAFDLSTTVPVNDGALTLVFSKTPADNPMISAIYVEASGVLNNVPAEFYGINAGGAAYESVVDGTPYMADAFHTPAGNSSAFAPPFTGTQGDDPLYESELWNAGDVTWEVPVRNGVYDVVIQLAEGWEGAQNPGVRKFNVHLEGNLIPPAPLDLTAVAGWRTVYDIPRTATVSDGFLTLLLEQVPGCDNPKLSALKLRGDPSAGLALPLGFFTWLQGFPGAGVSPLADRERDSISTLMEYALAGSPLANDWEIMPDLVPGQNDEFDYIFERPIDPGDLVYRVTASETLEDWVEIDPDLTIEDLGGGIERVIYANLRAAAAASLDDPDRCFFRLEIELVTPN